MKLNYIDSIRGIAILMVIMVHAAQPFQNLIPKIKFLLYYGQLGVQLFFVASAYTLCLSSNNRHGESNEKLKYGIRRYFRIAPLYYLGIMLYGCLTYFTHYVDFKANYTVYNVLANVFFLHGFSPAANNNIVPGGWSIGTEMIFYAIFPFLLRLVKLGLRRSKLYLYAFIFLGIALSQISVYFLSKHGLEMRNNSFLYFNIIVQLPVFIVGISYFFYGEMITKNKSVWTLFLGFFILTIITGSLFFSRHPYLSSIYPISAAFSFVFLFEIFKRVDKLNVKVLREIGQASYAMYIIHFLFASKFILLVFKFFPQVDNTPMFFVYLFLTIIFSFISAKILEKIIEKPGIRLGKKLINKL
ncbi:acyltransferase family protein [Sphingobacterium siyangense]|uniref:acyltransferase family protein n=1 Tax=Sphingobacterium siyangense TaxID=459529 RepID=UPI003DA278A7